MSLVQWSDTKSRSKCRELCRRWWTSSSVKIRAGQLKVKRLCRSENPRPSTSFHHMRPISTLCSLSSDGSFFSLFDCTYHIICWLHCCTSLSHGEWLKGHGVVSMWRYLQSRVCYCVLPFQQVRPQDEPDENIVVRDVPKEFVEQLESAP